MWCKLCTVIAIAALTEREREKIASKQGSKTQRKTQETMDIVCGDGARRTSLGRGRKMAKIQHGVKPDIFECALRVVGAGGVATNHMSAVAHLHQKPRCTNDNTPARDNDAASTHSRRPRQNTSTDDKGTARTQVLLFHGVVHVSLEGTEPLSSQHNSFHYEKKKKEKRKKCVVNGPSIPFVIGLM